MHRVRPGPANRSYGLQVAALAGVPRSVIDNARGMLETLEAESNARANAADNAQIPLFAGADPGPGTEQRLRELLTDVDPDSLSPKEALETLYKLKALLD
jgi:DNA mismatch repair protein MutS